MESQQARSPLVEQKPPELVGRPFAVIVYFYVRHGSNGTGQRGAATHNWFGRVLDSRSLRMLRFGTLGRSDSRLPDIS